MRRTLLIWFALAGAAFVAFAIALATGSTRLPLQDVLQALLSPGASVAGEIVTQLRLPRALAAFAVGGLLSLAGALMQILLRNPLADPYVLGLSGGAAVGALGTMLAGLGAFAANMGAIAGALLAITLVFVFARRDFARQQTLGALDASPRLLLTGVIMAAGWGALITLILTLAPEARLRSMLFWLVGDLNGAESWAPALGVLAAALVTETRSQQSDLMVTPGPQYLPVAGPLPAAMIGGFLLIIARHHFQRCRCGKLWNNGAALFNSMGKHSASGPAGCTSWS